MKGKISNQLGEIQIGPEVIALYAGTTAVECFGIVGMAAVSMKDGLVKLLKKESLTHGINVQIKDNRISVDFHVIVSYGVSISAVCGSTARRSPAKTSRWRPFSPRIRCAGRCGCECWTGSPPR